MRLVWQDLVVEGEGAGGVGWGGAVVALSCDLFHRRAELEHTYSKGLQKLAGKLLRASKEMSHR